MRPRQNKRKAANPLKPSALSETSCSSNHVENPINENDVVVDYEVAKKKQKSTHPSLKHHYHTVVADELCVCDDSLQVLLYSHQYSWSLKDFLISCHVVCLEK